MDGLGLRPRDQIQALTGLNKTACDVAIKFAKTGVLETGNKGVGRGRKKQDLNQNITKELRIIVDHANKQGIPTSAARLENELREKGIQVSARTITRYLRAEGYHWGKGTRQHVNHDAPGNMSRTATSTTRQHNDGLEVMALMPIKDANQLWSWFAAFVVYYDHEARQVQGKFVKDSVHIWPSIGKAHVKKSDKDKETVWNNVPHEIREANIMATDNDYHGNFNSEVFDVLFKRLCQKLVEMNLRGCQIHLDGAKYHFHDTNKSLPPVTRRLKSNNGS
ncbi:hypothetical protein BGX34_009183 [Mortierella sp. NVP85]|nr:hypothetical protein BGX34_009183 [Mortierella sp. NVP85]